jgi:hypothetical protein
LRARGTSRLHSTSPRCALANTPLHYVWLGRGEHVLYAFTSQLAAREFILAKTRRAAADSDGGAAAKAGLAAPLRDHAVCHNGYWSHWTEHINCGGSYISVQPGGSWGDLTSLGFNDMASSTFCTWHSTVDYCQNWEHVYFGGSSFSQPWGTTLLDLREIGWNDRISSVLVHTNN